MPLRLTTWNVNGIRNPFSYPPRAENKSFERMFDILEGDIIVFQETKIQKRDLRDDMVLIPGWDCFFSLPRHKKGYSGVVIYTRCSACSPIRAEEGLTGTLSSPGSPLPYRELPEDDQIGGYPTPEQLELLPIDPVTIDSEGRCVILEFPAFVLLGVYCPANRDETRDVFRAAFLNVLDMRVRNLTAMGKRVVLMGDMNISREVIDSAHIIEAIRKGKTTETEFLSSPSRRLFNQLVGGGGARAKDSEDTPVLLDVCRKFHPDRLGMYTCWEQRVNARPGNYGARIDYVLCSVDMEDWFTESNIQEGLMGSDHCPVYGIINDTVSCRNMDTNILDIMNPPGIFRAGIRKQPLTSSSLPLSGRLIPEFHRRRSLKDMFQTASGASDRMTNQLPLASQLSISCDFHEPNSSVSNLKKEEKDTSISNKGQPKRALENWTSLSPAKRAKKVGNTTSTAAKGQQTLASFVKQSRPRQTFTLEEPRSEILNVPDEIKEHTGNVRASPESSYLDNSSSIYLMESPHTPTDPTEVGERAISSAKESWAKLFTKRAPPRCEGHDEPCILLVTKKPGPNCGRSFWICPRPLGPSGNKEIGTPWRCSTFIWCSDWKSQ
nr:DNA lyase [Coccidioides immitis]